jgi:hypothetical protein
VGATQLATDGSSTYEIVCSAREGGVITSGGGFSDIYSRPVWQKDAVAGFLDKGVGVPKVRVRVRANPNPSPKPSPNPKP